jgi:hypothetical protein
MPPLALLAAAAHNVSLGRAGFPERIRDYAADPASGVPREHLLLSGLAGIISARVFARLYGGGPDAPAGDGAEITDARDIDPYVDTLAPHAETLFVADPPTRALAASRVVAYAMIEALVRNLLDYEDLEHRYSRGLIDGEQYRSSLEAFRPPPPRRRPEAAVSAPRTPSRSVR